MPAGALWTLRYNSTVDGRILARSDAARLRADEFVQNVAITSTRDSCVVVIQFRDDQDGPYDHRLRREIESWIVEPEPTQETRIDPQTRDELISRAIGTPIQRRMVPQNWNPIRRNIDYTAVARRTFLVEDIPRIVSDPPYASAPLDQGNVGSAVSSPESLGESLQEGIAITQLAAELGVPSRNWGPPLMGIPPWLKLGVWVRYSKDTFAEVVKIESAGDAVGGAHVFFKLWRIKAPVQSLCLIDFQKNWVPCERPIEPLSRYKRILKGF